MTDELRTLSHWQKFRENGGSVVTGIVDGEHPIKARFLWGSDGCIGTSNGGPRTEVVYKEGVPHDNPYPDIDSGKSAEASASIFESLFPKEE